MKLPKVAAVTALAALGSCTGSETAVSRRPEDLLIRSAVVVSPEREAPSSPTDVLIRGERINDLGSDLSTEGLAPEQILDGTGRFLTPGLIDGHTHLSGVPGMRFDQMEAHPEVVAGATTQFPRSYLFYGFTTVVDLHSGPEPIAEWNKRDVGAQAYWCGGAPIIDGYPMTYIPEAVRYRITPFFLLDDRAAGEMPPGVDPAEHTPAAVVARMKAAGAVCVKTHYETGFGGKRDLPTPSLELIRELVAAAHAEGMPVILHANSQEAQAFGVGAGVDAFAHGVWTWNDRSATALAAEITEILDGVIAGKVGWQPTIQVLYGERDLHDPEYLSQDALKDALPPSLIEWYRTEEGQWYRRRMAEIPFVADLVAKERWHEIDGEAIARVGAALTYLASNDAALLFGSDTPSDVTFANPPGLNGRFEMGRWREYGVTPSQFLRAATIGNAEFFGLEEEIGTVEVGKRADLLLLAEDPSKDIDAFDSIEIVFLGGQALARDDLSARRTVTRGATPGLP